jgi:uncharacterized iron-regulated protein
MPARPRLAWLLGIAITLAGCATARPGAEPWQARFGRDHPLTGRIWDVGRGRFIGPETLTARLAAARFVLLGESHDNPDHHALQARIVRALAAAGRRPAVAFEMLTTAQAPALARHLATAPGDAAGLGEAVGWRESGWPDWRHYQPIAEAALAAGLPLVAANLPLPTARAVSRGAAGVLDARLVARYGLDRPPPPDVERAMAAELRESHCGQAPEGRLPGMIAAQRARDARMAESLLAGQADGAVLVAGAGHVRTDRGVPSFLRLGEPGARVAALAFLEVRPAAGTPADYAARPEGRLPFDFVWFTPRAGDEDPCARLEKTLERLQRPP